MTYSPPVDQLLTLGDIRQFDSWPDYLALGFDDSHIDALIALATDQTLMENRDDEGVMWAAVHAWRTLGMLRAEAAVQPLINLFHELTGSYWTASEIPAALSLIGPSSVPYLRDYVANDAVQAYARARAVRALEIIAGAWEDIRKDAIAAIHSKLEHYADNEESLNGFLVKSLANLNHEDSLPLIEAAYAGGHVNERAAGGDWYDLQVKYGLKPPRTRTTKSSARAANMDRDSPAQRATKARFDRQKARAKRKQSKKSRQKNRRRK